MKYTTEDGNKVITFLQSHNINCELIGSLKKRGTSEHDIDVWIKEPDTKQNRDKILKLLNPTKIVNTDWEGMYCTTDLYGDVDIFFVEPT